jgi:hypothetical protein
MVTTLVEGEEGAVGVDGALLPPYPPDPPQLTHKAAAPIRRNTFAFMRNSIGRGLTRM